MMLVHWSSPGPALFRDWLNWRGPRPCQGVAWGNRGPAQFKILTRFGRFGLAKTAGTEKKLESSCKVKVLADSNSIFHIPLANAAQDQDINVTYFHLPAVHFALPLLLLLASCTRQACFCSPCTL